MLIYIKHMVSKRCEMMVKATLDTLKIPYERVSLGMISLSEELTDSQFNNLNGALIKMGFEIGRDKKEILLEKIKIAVIELVHKSDKPPLEKTSVYLSRRLQYNYSYLSNLFSHEMGMTLEQYVIAHKIERVKEMILENKYSLTQIASRMHYSSVAHLSYQFKKVTGVTPSQFKQLKLYKTRVKLEDVGKGLSQGSMC